MGSIGIQYSPFDPGLPLEAYISIIEYEAKSRALNEPEKVSLALSHLAPKEALLSDFEGVTLWSDLKSRLVDSFGELQYSTQTKMDLISSLNKRPLENCHHFLIRCRHVANTVAHADEWTQLLFLLGLALEERSMFDATNLPTMEQICDTLNACCATEMSPNSPAEVTSVKSEVDDNNVIESDKKDVIPILDEETIKQALDEIGTKDDPDFQSSLGGDDFELSLSDVDVHPKRPGAKRKSQLESKNQSEIKRKYNCKPALCQDCNHVASSKTELEEHVLSEHRDTVVCAICKEKMLMRTLKRHCKQMHRGNEQKCDVCGEEFPTMAKLNQHVRNFHDEKFRALEERALKGEVVIDRNPTQVPPVKPLGPEIINKEERVRNRSIKVRTKCALCPRVFEGSSAFVTHFKEAHHGNRYGCDHCDFLNNDLTRLLDHRLHIHDMPWGGMPVYYCKIDGCNFKQIDHHGFLDHVKVKHDTKEKNWKCTICDKSYVTKFRLKIHTDTVHLNMYKVRCEVEGCNFASTGPKQMEIHMDTHRDASERQLSCICQECGVVYSGKSNLDWHVRRVHRKELHHECPECPGRKFFNKHQLQKHHEDVHGEKNFVCSQCSRAFGREVALKRHIEITHMQIKKFRCTICNQYFGKSGNLSYHVGRKHMNFTDQEAKKKRHLARQHEAFEKLDEPTMPGPTAKIIHPSQTYRNLTTVKVLSRDDATNQLLPATIE